ncbi:MAG: hypothetical protein E5X33_26855 [Mesorhizobium sp.]|uniref:hypothetical protein n=1 Tax=Mesorhizobium sp. TaxID=1871066 RepID=UPI0011FEDC40|nr:hypothetical protein [Mesorhizobium sp.]TIR17076.1 MAG: hypothetical protein E5X33_26855 [Mesorhizobium sp.]
MPRHLLAYDSNFSTDNQAADLDLHQAAQLQAIPRSNDARPRKRSFSIQEEMVAEWTDRDQKRSASWFWRAAVDFALSGLCDQYTRKKGARELGALLIGECSDWRSVIKQSADNQI